MSKKQKSISHLLFEWSGVIALVIALSSAIFLYQQGAATKKSVDNANITIASLTAKAFNSESAVDSLETWKKNIDVDDNSSLKRLMTAQIDKYVEDQKTQAEKARYKKFDAAPETAEGHVYGEETAKIALIEFTDYDCPFCKRFHHTPKNIVDNSQGNVKWIFKHFPLDSIHPQARAQAIAAECVSEIKGNRAFWAFTDSLMSAKNGGSKVSKFAADLGIDPQQLSDCINNGDKEQVVLADSEEGMKLGVNGTPATVIMNTESGKAVMLSGAVSEKVMLERIKTLL